MEETWPLNRCTTKEVQAFVKEDISAIQFDCISEESTSDSEANHFIECLIFERLFPSVGVCAPVWECVPQCGKVCPTVEGCAPMREDVPWCFVYCHTFVSCGKCICIYRYYW